MTRFLMICALALFPFAEVAFADDDGTSVSATITIDPEDFDIGMDDDGDEDDLSAEGPKLGNVVTNVTNSLSGLGKALTIPAYARGAATEVKGVVELKREHHTETSTESHPLHVGQRHRGHR